MYLFAALQRPLGYPEVPRAKQEDTLSNAIVTLKARQKDLEARIKLLETEVRGTLDLKTLKELGRPEMLKPPEDIP